MNPLKSYIILDFFDWVKKYDKNILLFIQNELSLGEQKEKTFDELEPYAHEFIRASRLNIQPWELTDSIKGYLLYRYGDPKETEIIEYYLKQKNRNYKQKRSKNFKTFL